MSDMDTIRSLLMERADYQSRLRLLPYDGTPEIKTQGDNRYLYVRKRVGSRVKSTYAGVYSDELYEMLQRNAKESRELNKKIRQVNRKLIEAGYVETELSESVLINLDHARASMKNSIYDQAILEGVATSYPQTEEIIDNGIVNGMTASDIQKVLNLKHAWEFILDEDVIRAETDYYMLSHIAGLVNEGFFTYGGRIRGVPVTIGGTSYVPPLPVEADVKDDIKGIAGKDAEPIDIATELCLYVMKSQLFLDGNKRAAVIFANHYLIAHGRGLLVIPESEVARFKTMLIGYYEGKDVSEIREYMKAHCWKKIN